MAVTLAAIDLAKTDWLGLAGLLAVGFAIAWLSGVAFARWSLRNPARRTYASALVRGQPGTPMELDVARFGVTARGFEQWEVERADGRGRLPVWEFAGDDAQGPVVVMTHGWGDGRVGGLLRVEPFVKQASRVILWDMAGHGDAPAGASGLGRVEAADLQRLLERVDGEGRGVVLFGWSLGAGVSIEAAGRGGGRVVGVVCEAPYTLPQVPASRVTRAMGVPGLKMVEAALWTIGGSAWMRTGGPFDRAGHAARLRVPLLVLHGEHDPVCPLQGGRAIAEAGRGELVVIKSGRHNDLWVTPACRGVCCSAVSGWLSRLQGKVTARAGAERPTP